MAERLDHAAKAPFSGRPLSAAQVAHSRIDGPKTCLPIATLTPLRQVTRDPHLREELRRLKARVELLRSTSSNPNLSKAGAQSRAGGIKIELIPLPLSRVRPKTALPTANARKNIAHRVPVGKNLDANLGVLRTGVVDFYPGAHVRADGRMRPDGLRPAGRLGPLQWAPQWLGPSAPMRNDQRALGPGKR